MSWVNWVELAVAIVSAPFAAVGLINGTVDSLFGEATNSAAAKRKAKR